jgi:hypothetical protein
MPTIEAETLKIMRERGGTWAAYQNVTMDSADLGHLKFLKFGPECTFVDPPERLPDTATEINWHYHLMGQVNLETGEIK